MHAAARQCLCPGAAASPGCPRWLLRVLRALAPGQGQGSLCAGLLGGPALPWPLSQGTRSAPFALQLGPGSLPSGWQTDSWQLALAPRAFPGSQQHRHPRSARLLLPGFPASNVGRAVPLSLPLFSVCGCLSTPALAARGLCGGLPSHHLDPPEPSRHVASGLKVHPWLPGAFRRQSDLCTDSQSSGVPAALCAPFCPVRPTPHPAHSCPPQGPALCLPQCPLLFIVTSCWWLDLPHICATMAVAAPQDRGVGALAM